MSDLSETETKIVNAINFIRNDQRKRPCTKEIFNNINNNLEEFEKIDISVYHEAMVKLQSDEIIYDGGKGGKESFFINKDIFINNGIHDIIGNDSDITNFINDKFYETLINRIKLEVKHAINLMLNNNSINSERLSIPDNNKDTNDIISILKDELQFLKDELSSKDKIIEMIIKDKPCINESASDNTDNDDSFVYTKKSFKPNYTHDNKNSSIYLNNRFEILSTTPVTNCEELNESSSNDINGSSNNVHKPNIKNKHRSTTIIGDSIIKHINPFKMKKDMHKGDKLYIKSFPGATTECMSDYVKPSLKFNPDLIIIHTGANDIRSTKSPEIIANDIVNLATKIKSNHNDVIVSGLIARNDELNTKSQQVNVILFDKCNERNLFYIDNTNIIARKHLNSSGVHLNLNGTAQLANNFLDCINL